MSERHDGGNVTPSDQALLATVDRMLRTPVESHRPAAGTFEAFAAALAGAVPVMHPAFQDRLERRLVMELLSRHESVSADARPSRISGRWSWAAKAAAVLAAGFLAAVVLSIPAARAWAGDAATGLMAHFGYSRAPVHLAVPTERRVYPAPGTVPSPTPRLSRAEAERQAGFQVRIPRHVPGGYEPLEGFSYDSGHREVGWAAWDTQDRLCGPSISLVQSPTSEQRRYPSPIGEANATAVAVDRVTGLLVENTEGGICQAFGPDGTARPPSRRIVSLLAWERDGVRYTLSAPAALGRPEILRIADSLG